MKREILDLKFGKHISGCCPGHDDFPNDTYRSNRSKRARSRDKKIEHRYARRVNRALVDSTEQDAQDFKITEDIQEEKDIDK